MVLSSQFDALQGVSENGFIAEPSRAVMVVSGNGDTSNVLTGRDTSKKAGKRPAIAKEGSKDLKGSSSSGLKNVSAKGVTINNGSKVQFKQPKAGLGKGWLGSGATQAAVEHVQVNLDKSKHTAVRIDENHNPNVTVSSSGKGKKTNVENDVNSLSPTAMAVDPVQNPIGGTGEVVQVDNAMHAIVNALSSIDSSANDDSGNAMLVASGSVSA